MTDRPPPPRYPASPPERWPDPVPLAPEAPPPPPPKPPWWDDPRHRAFTWGAVAIVFAIVVGALVGASAANPTTSVAFSFSSSDATTDSSTDSESSSSSSSATTTTVPSLDDVVLEIEKFVEQARGLTYKAPVNVQLASESEFQRLLLADFDKQHPALLKEQAELRALGLIPPDTDLIASEKTFLGIAAGGFYDPSSKRLVVRADAITPFTREVLAHELTHALDDQYFDLNRPQLDDTDDETGFAFSALVEGNARRIEDAYVAAMSPSDQVDAMAEQTQQLAAHPELFSLPPVLLTLAQAPYDDGSTFATDLVDAGGQSALDKAFATPPITSEQIFDAARYISGEGPVAVPAPTADGTSTGTGVLGELMFRELLFDALSSGAEVQRAITGWGGDSFVTWTTLAGQSCLRDTFVGDTPGDTRELVQSVKEWGADHSAVLDAPADGPATFTVCA